MAPKEERKAEAREQSSDGLGAQRNGRHLRTVSERHLNTRKKAAARESLDRYAQSAPFVLGQKVLSS